MNKQEALKKIEKLDGLTIKDKDFNFAIEMIPKGETLEIVDQLDEPEKPVVPQFVADFYESIKDDFEVGVYDLCVNLYTCNLEGKIKYWFGCDDNKPIETLAKMKLYGYEVKKEKLYTVEIPDPNGLSQHVLVKGITWGIFIGHKCSNDWREVSDYQLTEAEIKKDFDWAWQWAKEVENE